MKQLLQHYKEVRETLEAESFGFKRHDTGGRGEAAGYGVSISSDIYYITVDRLRGVYGPYRYGNRENLRAELQKEQLEIEALLYGYWERKSFIVVADDRHASSDPKPTFNEWLEAELSKLED